MLLSRQAAKLCVLAIVTGFALKASGIEPSRQRIILYPPYDAVTGKYDESKACFSFKYGLLKQFTGKDWDLGYGFMRIGEEDWFTVNGSGGNRSVMKDIGELTWDDPITASPLEPLPGLAKGQRREIVVDVSADTYKEWAATTQIFTKVSVGHMYVVHVKDQAADFYVLFRVEEFEQNHHCTISWRLIPIPETVNGR